LYGIGDGGRGVGGRGVVKGITRTASAVKKIIFKTEDNKSKETKSVSKLYV
jgi:hypothetical protein